MEPESATSRPPGKFRPSANAWLLILLGFAVGVTTGRLLVAPRAPITSDPGPGAGPAAAPSPPAPGASVPPAVAAPGSPAGARAEARSLLRELFAPPTPLGDARVAALLAGRDAASLAALARELEGSPPGPGQERLLAHVVEAWAAREGERAAAFALGLPRRLGQGSLQRAAAGWARLDPSAALAWIDVAFAGDRDLAESLAMTVGQSLADVRPEQALALASTLSPERATAFREQAVRSLVAQGRLGEARAVTENLLRSPEGQPVARDLASEWANWDPAAAATWAATVDGAFEDLDARRGLLHPVLHRWAATDPLSAVAWLDGPGARLDHEELRDSIATGWAWSSPDAPAELATWLATRAGDGRDDPFREKLADVLLPTDPEAALAWSLAIVDPAFRRMQVGWSLEVWEQREPKAAAAWAEANAARLIAEVGLEAPGPQDAAAPASGEAVAPGP